MVNNERFSRTVASGVIEQGRNHTAMAGVDAERVHYHRASEAARNGSAKVEITLFDASGPLN